MPHLCRLQVALLRAMLVALHAAPLGAQAPQPVLTPTPGDSGVSVEISRRANGQMAKRVFLKNGKPNGLWQEWDADGRVTYTAEWRDGQGEGVWFYFHSNGVVRERGWVTNDMWHEGWHANRQKSSEGTFVRGAKVGPFRYWRKDGTPPGPWAELLAPATAPVPVLGEGWPAKFNAWDVTLTHDLEVPLVGTGDSDGENRRIMMRRWQQNAWQPVALAPFADTTTAEGSPVVSAEGKWVYLCSARHVKREPENPRRELYRASRVSRWKTVERVTFTPKYGEVALSLARDGRGVL